MRKLKNFSNLKKKLAFCREESILFAFLGIKVILYAILEIWYQIDSYVNLSHHYINCCYVKHNLRNLQIYKNLQI